MDNCAHKRSWPIVIDLFCGSGAVTQGLKNKHFKVAAAVDSDGTVCRTYRANHPNVPLYEKDIRGLCPCALLKHIPTGRQLDLLVVCAPCQPFSSQNRNKGNDEREDLILESVRFIRELKPKLVFFENVPGLRNSPVMVRLRQELSIEGYKLSDTLRVDAAALGVPQRRLRCVMLASPNASATDILIDGLPDLPKKTVREAFLGLQSLMSGEASAHDPLHFARNHQDIVLERLKYIRKDGGDRFDLPPHLELNCHRGHKGHPDVYGRMKWDDVAPTLTTGCTDLTRGRFAHPEDNRAITLREAAALQTFPDSFQFEGSPSEIAAQIGNAVPVAMVENLAPIFRSAIRMVERGS